MAKIYQKVGNKTAEEKKYVKELEKFISANPDKEIGTAKNFSQLKKLYEKYCTEEVEFEETELSEEEKELERVLNEDKEEGSKTGNEEEDESSSDAFDGATSEGNDENPNKEFIDPFNKEEPIIRDHVLNEGFTREGDKAGQSNQSSFNEPTSFRESFDIPQEDDKDSINNASEPNNSKQRQQKSDSFNPASDEMTGAKKKKSTKRFAKYIVDFACLAAEKGFVWYANKNINTNIQIVKEEFDLGILISLDGVQQITIIQFFEQQRTSAETLAKIDNDDKEELIDALSAWMLEKGFTPTPTQELMIVCLSILGKQAVLLMAHTATTNSVVSQLRQQTEQHGRTEEQVHQEVKEEKKPEPEQEKESETYTKIKEEFSAATEQSTETETALTTKKKSGKKQVGDETKE